MGRPSRRARTVRQRKDFDLRALVARLNPPPSSGGLVAWTLDEIRNARDMQLEGQFSMPARLAEMMRTDDALFTAYENRLAPQRCLHVKLVPASQSAAAQRVASEAEALFGTQGIGLHPETLADVNGCLANHGVAFGVNTWTPREDGSRTDVELNLWPIEHVRWNELERCFMARTDFRSPLGGGVEVPIVHGDGRWVIFRKHEHKPWSQEACILAGALVWARHAYAARDWAKGSVAHGNAKVVGEMSEGVALQDADGNLTPEAESFLDLLQGLFSSDAPYGIRPFGSKTEFVASASTAWQVWAELMLNGEKAAARIYLGTDGTLGSQGGAPGVDIATLFGVATTKVQGDLAAITRGLQTGLVEPWSAVNFGDSSLTPLREYQMPDPDAARAHEETAKRDEQFHAEIDRLSKRFVVTQEVVDAVAARYGVTAPQLKPAPAATTQPGATPTNGAPKPTNGATAS